MAPEPWKFGLFSCFSDMKICCLTYCCPCVTFGRIAEIVGQGTPLYFGYPIEFVRYAYRSKMRQQYNLEGSCSGDFLIHCFCEPCALCQEYRELQSRGFNMTIGWQGNMDERNHEVVPPKVEEGMNRNK